ncbi:MAG: tRNA(Ile)-lysidine synthase [Leptospiraceae bacterium]|nr:MAG: tRNA(Ile)-lysidine synthase [Leptospiraceae bacterium]
MKNKKMQKSKFKFISFNKFIKDLENSYLDPVVRNIFIPDENFKYIIAISGGPDSVFLSYVYYKLYSNQFIKEPVLFHFNHKIREDSDKEENFVIQLAEQLNLPLYVETKNVLKSSKKLKKNLEETARILRYRALFRLTQDLNENSIIVTGHHADDYLETIFLRLLRGSSFRNIYFPYLRSLPLTIAKKRYFVRVLSPLLLFEKLELLKYLEKNQIQFVVDSSNYNIDFKRNFIRHNVIAPLKKIGFHSGIIWQRTHLNLIQFNQDYRILDYYILEKSLFYGLGNREIKIIMDQISKNLGILPFSSSIISEFIYESYNNKIQIETKECYIESVKNKIWFIRKDSLLFQEPVISYNNNYYEVYWNNQKRIYKDDIIKIQYLKIEKDLKLKNYLKEIMREKEFPRILRQHIPYIIYKDKIRILFSFLDTFWDYNSKKT